jgi:hypothetical protein
VTRDLTWIAALIAIGALTFVGAASPKEGRTTVCGRSECRTVTNGISGVATLPARLPAPREGRFYTVAVQLGSSGWKVVYEQRREIVRAADSRARPFLGRGWARLTADLRPHYAKAVRGLAPMRAAPPYAG